MEEYIGTIKLWAGSYIPQGYMPCNGQELPINRYSLLYNVIGTSYGGDGKTTFNLPDFKDRLVIGIDKKEDLNTKGGETKQTVVTTAMLSANNLPAHTHEATATFNVNNDSGDSINPINNVIGSSGADKAFNNKAVTGSMNASAITVKIENDSKPQTLAVTRGEVNVQQVYIGIGYIICVEGMFPERDDSKPN